MVITILAILGTIAFLSLQGYSTNARNSTRTNDLGSLKSSLELYSLKVGGYPTPSNPVPITYSGGTVWTQGTIGDSVIKNLSNLNKKPVDPSIGNEYSYSLLNTRGEYQLGSIEEIGFGRDETELIPNSYAAQNSALAIILGSYNGQILKLSTGGLDYILAIPSIISTDTTTTNLTTILTNKQLSYDGYGNLPGSYDGKGYIMTGSFNYGPTNPVIFSGLTSNLSSSGTLQISFIDSLRNAYSGSQLTSDGNIGQLINATNDTDKKSLLSGIFSNKAGGLIGTVIISSTSTTSTVTQWTSVDSNCDIPNITIGTQVWAGCNSTLGTGIEWGKQDSGTDGTVGSCYPSYDGVSNVGGCTIGGTSMASNTKANTWYSGTNANFDQEYANIWGKLYTWANSPSACPSGWHVPSDTEWETLETTLNGSNCRNITNGELCDGLGWKSHNSKTTSNNMAQALKIPLSGNRIISGVGFNNRGSNSFLWSSTPSSTSAYIRNLYWNNSTVNRTTSSQVFGYSVRCLKD